MENPHPSYTQCKKSALPCFTIHIRHFFNFLTKIASHKHTQNNFFLTGSTFTSSFIGANKITSIALQLLTSSSQTHTIFQ